MVVILLLCIGTSVGTILRFIVSTDDAVKVTELPQLSLDHSNRVVYCLDMTCDVQLVCGDSVGCITVYSHPDQSTTVRSQFDHGKG